MASGELFLCFGRLVLDLAVCLWFVGARLGGWFA